MIIAIDEFGDFNPESERYNFFVAAFINQDADKYEGIKQSFNEWKKSIPKEKVEKDDEVKGRNLNCEELLSFANQVISNDVAPISCMQVRIIPADNEKELIDKFRKIELDRFNKLVELCLKDGKKKLAEQYRQLTLWYNKRNNHQYLKIVILNNIIPKAIKDAIGHSIILDLLGSSFNLLNIKLKIDRDFINPGHGRTYWGELLRNTFYFFSKENPIPLLENWKESGHPFLDKYRNKGYLDLREVFVDNLDFVNSHEHFEVQIADILCTIFNKFHNHDMCKEAYEALLQSFPKKKSHNIVDIVLNEDFPLDNGVEIID